ncbi:PIN-like domain-containing protein [Brevibacillus laterosporus]|uniref:PIN-like domain-containing protein n=1 Tax=Brevibacillus laterosporus TaxID=1465 RepID=UPI0035A65EA1
MPWSLKFKKYKRQHPTINVTDFTAKVKEAFWEIIKQLEIQEEQHPDLMKNDILCDEVENLFIDRIGEPYNQNRHDIIFSDGEKRYKDNEPPGYEDAKEKKDKVTKYNDLIIKDMYGDLIVWNQIIDMVKQENKPVIFVTGDVKDDWFQKFKGKTPGPRLELLYEFKKETGFEFYVYQTYYSRANRGIIF